MAVKILGDKIKGKFIKRPNRFEALVDIDGKIETVHVPNTGRMAELLKEGAEVTLVKSDNPKRKTKYSMIFVNKNGHLLCIHSVLANKVFEDAVINGKINWLSVGKNDIKREVMFHNSRIDFFMDGEDKTFVEVKCATYEEDSIAMFPDAPTDRGRRHIEELIKAKKDGFNAAIVIVSFMDYVKEFTPNYKIDNEFGEKLKNALEHDIIVKAYNCKIGEDEIFIKEEMNIYF